MTTQQKLNESLTIFQLIAAIPNLDPIAKKIAERGIEILKSKTTTHETDTGTHKG